MSCIPGAAAVVAVWGERRNCGWAELFPIVDARVSSDVCPMFFALGAGDCLDRPPRARRLRRRRPGPAERRSRLRRRCRRARRGVPRRTGRPRLLPVRRRHQGVGTRRLPGVDRPLPTGRRLPGPGRVRHRLRPTALIRILCNHTQDHITNKERSDDHHRHTDRQRRQHGCTARCPGGADRRAGGRRVHLAGHVLVGARHPQPLDRRELLGPRAGALPPVDVQLRRRPSRVLRVGGSRRDTRRVRARRARPAASPPAWPPSPSIARSNSGPSPRPSRDR